MNENETIKLAIKSLLEVVQTGAKNIEIAVMTADNTVKVNTHFFTHLFYLIYSFFITQRLEQEEVESVVAEIEKEKEAEAEKKKKPSVASGSS